MITSSRILSGTEEFHKTPTWLWFIFPASLGLVILWSLFR